MDGNTRQQFQIHLPGLLKVLAENLYSTKKVAIRELLQNAHDSCVRRSVEGTERNYKPRVTIAINRDKRTISIQDNGSGLTAEDVTTYLSTIGRSYTRELGEKLSILSPEEASQLIGQFGLGFLSAFLIGSEVTLTTRSIQPGSPALRWHSTGDVHYDLTTAPDNAEPDVGTTVTLLVKPGASFMLNRETLIETIQQYADFLPLPIYVEGDPVPINIQTQPWNALDPQIATREFIQRHFHSDEPLAIIQLHDQEVDLGHDTLSIPLNGFLFVPASSAVSIREYGDVSVYIRRMFICAGQRDLLPPWARFVQGVIDCPYLQPTASREELHQDDTFTAVQQALERQLLEGLRTIARDEPDTWKMIVHSHSTLITAWAVRNNEFFAQIADIAMFHTTRGLMNLPDYLNVTDGTLYYVTRELGSLQEQMLGEGYGAPVIEAIWFAVTPFLEKYAAFKPGVKLVQLDGNSKQLLRPVSESGFELLLEFFRKRGVKARMVSFKPETVPALVVYPKDAEFIADTRQALDAGELPGPFAGLISDYMQKLSERQTDDLSGTLYLNAACPTVSKLTANSNTTSREAALTMIYQVARLFAGRMLTPADVTAAFGEAMAALEALTQ
ncbi:MAG: ATP-binding protein [Aggregatilineales bacterium]